MSRFPMEWIKEWKERLLSKYPPKYLLLSLVFVLLVLGLCAYVYLSYFLYGSSEDVVVEIPRGAGLGEIARKLENGGVVRSAKAFVGYVLLSGREKDLRAGEYEFRAGSVMADVLDKLIRGDVVLREITIPEGLTVAEIADLLGSRGVVERESFLDLALDPGFANEVLGDSVGTLEGYLYPDTYKVRRDTSAEELIERMVARHREVFRQIDLSAIELSEREIVTLASIIEKETAVDDEKPLVSAVLHNRLRVGMKLE